MIAVGGIGAGGTGGVWCGVMLVGAGGGGGIVDGAWAVICGAEAAIERVTRTDCSGVAVDCDDASGRVDADGNTKSKTFKETHNLKSGRIWCIGTQNVENGYKRAFFARLGEGLKKY